MEKTSTAAHSGTSSQFEQKCSRGLETERLGSLLHPNLFLFNPFRTLSTAFVGSPPHDSSCSRAVQFAAATTADYGGGGSDDDHNLILLRPGSGGMHLGSANL